MRVSSLHILTACVVVLSSSPAAADWQKEEIFPFATFYAPSIVVDSHHVPHVAATSRNGALLYISPVSGGWQQQVVSQDWSWVQGSRGLRLGPDGQPRIFGGSHLYTYTGSAWNRTNARFVIWEGGMAMAIDAQGVSRFCNTWYVSYTGENGLAYDGRPVAVIDRFPTMDSCEMEFTRDGLANIVAVQSAGLPVTFYRQKLDGTWDAEQIGPGLFPAIAVDAADHIQVCYTTLTGNELVYASRVAPNEWTSETVGKSSHHVSMAVGSNGRVCISFYDPDAAALMLTSRGREETRWHFSTVAGNASAGGSLAIDGTSIHLAFLDTYDRLYYASAPLATGVGTLPALDSASIRAVPNPFNPSTTVEYNVPARGHVRVTVYDAAGRVMEKLVDGVRDAGAYRVQYRARGASGVYFARVEAAGRTATTKIVLLK